MLTLRRPFRMAHRKVVSYDAPEVVVVAKEDSLKHDQTKKIVIYGAAEPASDLLWTQVDRGKSAATRWLSLPDLRPPGIRPKFRRSALHDWCGA